MTTVNIPQEHIDRLMANPAEAQLFDEVYGQGAANKYLQEAQTTQEEREPEPVKGITRNIAIGAKEALRETLETLEGLSDVAEENIPLGGFAFGSDAKNGFIEYLNPEEYKEKIGGDLEADAGIFQTAADVLPESGEAEGVAGNLSRGVSQFLTGFVGGGTILKGMGWVRGANQGYNVTRSFVQGGIADFAVFDEKEERLADFIIEAVPSAQDTFIEYLAADEDDTFMEGKMKNVLEGALLGGVAEALFKTIKMFKGTRSRLDKGDKKGAKEFAEKEAKEVEKSQTKAAEELDEVEEAAKGNRGIPNTKKEKFKVKSLKSADPFLDNVKTLIKKIRSGDADIDDLDDIPVSIDFIDDVDEAASLVRIISQEVNKVTKEFDDVQGHDQVWKEADRMLQSPTETMVKAQELAKVTDKAPAITIAMRVVFNGLYQRVQKEVNLLEQGLKDSEDDLDDAIDILQSFYRLDRQIGKNTGRALEIRKLAVGSESNATKKIKRLLDEADVRPEEGIIELKKKIRQVKDKKGIIAVLKAFQEKIGVNFVNKVWINALLSNPKTHAINMTSNTIMALIRPIEQYIGGVLTRDKSARIEAVSTAAGIIKYYQDALQLSRIAFNKSDSILDTKNFKVDLPKNTFNKNASAFERGVIEAPTRFLNAEDEFFKQLNYRAKLYGMAVAEGLRKGLSKKKTHRTSNGRMYSELDKFIEDKFEQGFNPDFSAKNKVALEYAQENTFTKALGKSLGKTVQSAVNQVPILRQIMPFVRTPVNIARAVWDRSPIGIFRKKFREELFSPDKSIRASAVGKQTIGTALFVSALVLANNGMITGGVPKDKNLRRQKFDAGWRPYSFKIEDKYYSFERLDPFGMFFGLVADYAAVANEVTAEERQELADANMMALMNQMELGDYSEIVGGGLMATAKNLSSKTYIKSLTDFISAFSSNDRREIKRYGLQKVGSFVPNIVKGIMNDPLYREARTLTDTLKSRVGLYGDIDPSFNVLGEVRSKGQSWWESFISPITVTEDTEDIIIKELDRLNQPFSPIGNLQGFNSNIDLTKFTKGDKNAFVRYNELISENGNLRRDLERLISSQGYQKLSDNPISETQSYRGSKQAAIKQIINKYKRRAKARLIREGFLTAENLDLADAFRNDKRNQRRAERGFTLLPTE